MFKFSLWNSSSLSPTWHSLHIHVDVFQVDVSSKDKYCWCVNPAGVEIPGTRMAAPSQPDCDFGTFYNICFYLPKIKKPTYNFEIVTPFF